MARPLSEMLYDMSVRAKAVEDKAAIASQETKDQVDARVAKAKADAQRRRDEAQARASAAQRDVNKRWATLQAGVRSQLDDIHSSIDEHKEEHDAKVALRRAEDAEENAAEAIDFAMGALDEADESVLAAIDARLYADALN